MKIRKKEVTTLSDQKTDFKKTLQVDCAKTVKVRIKSLIG